MDQITLQAKSRKPSGTKSARRLRKGGELPAIVYGHGEAPIAVALPAHEVINALHHGAHVFNLSLDGAEHQCFIKEVQYDYLGTNPVHLDLTRVDQNERVKVTVQVELRGVPKGVTQGGVLDQLISDVEVECPVMSIPELLRPRVNDLDVGESLHVRDLELPEGVVPVGDPDDVVCTVRALAEEVEEEADEGAEGTAGGSEPELIRKPKEEEEKSGD